MSCYATKITIAMLREQITVSRIGQYNDPVTGTPSQTTTIVAKTWSKVSTDDKLVSTDDKQEVQHDITIITRIEADIRVEDIVAYAGRNYTVQTREPIDIFYSKMTARRVD